jgi:hypothetical protein
MLSRVASVFLITLGLLIPGALFGQFAEPATFQPAAPTAANTIVVRATFPNTCFNFGSRASTEVDGTVIRTTVNSPGCMSIAGPDIHLAWAIGPLPANTYTYEIYYKFSPTDIELRSRQTLVVSADIPAFSRGGLLALALTLCIAGFVALRLEP